MLLPPQSPSPLVNNWIERHRDPRSFALHLFGIPGTILGVLLMPIYLMLMSITLFGFALILFLGGYGLQFLGSIRAPERIRAVGFIFHWPLYFGADPWVASKTAPA